MILTRILETVRRKGLRRTLVGGARHLHNKYLEIEMRRHYQRAGESNRRFDSRYGVETYSQVSVEDLGVTTPSLACAVHYEAMHEELFRQATAKLRVDHKRFTFVDYGSGKGKVLMLASLYPYKMIVGVEFSSQLCRICDRNLNLFSSPRQQSRNFEIVCADALTYRLPSGPTAVFIYNPFRNQVMEGVIRNIAESIRTEPRPVWIVYCNPNFAEFIDQTEMFDLVDQARRYRVYRSR